MQSDNRKTIVPLSYEAAETAYAENPTERKRELLFTAYANAGVPHDEFSGRAHRAREQVLENFDADHRREHPAPPPQPSPIDVPLSDGWDAPAVVGPDAHAAVQQLTDRHEERSSKWSLIVAHRAGLEADRFERIEAAIKRAADAKKSRKLSSVGGWSTMVLFDDAIEYKGRRYQLTREVRATVSQIGNTSSSQGWVMRTQNDNREVRVVVEGPDVYLDVRAAKGQSSATDLSTSVANFAFRQAANQARKFAAAVNNAANNSDNVRSHRLSVVEAAARAAESAYNDVDVIEEIVVKQQSVAESQRAVAAGDRAVLESVEVPGMTRRDRRAHRALVANLQREIDHYNVASLDGGRRPYITAPTTSSPAPATPSSTRAETPAAESTTPDPSQVLDSIKQLGDLHAAGILTEDEFVSKKSELLGRI